MAGQKQKAKKDWWFSLNNGVKDDPKILLLPSDTLRWQWIVLLCVASANDGKIPSLDVAAVALRMPPNKAAQVIAKLHKARLLDDDSENGGYFVAHDWADHRPKRNKGEATNAERQAAFRDRQKAESNGEVTAQNAVTDNGNITGLRVRDKTKRDDQEDARATEATISEDAYRLADEVTKLAGHDLDFVPPSWIGAPYRAQQWLNQGWPEELILLSVREQAAKKRDGPAKSIQYFEPGIASAIAKANQPLPNVVEIPAKTVEVNRAVPTANSAAAAARRLQQSIERQLAENGVDSEPYQPTYLRLPAG